MSGTLRKQAGDLRLSASEESWEGEMVEAPAEPEMSSAPAGSMRELLHVAFPLVISAGSLSLMNVVDRAFLAKLSVDALAASMPAAMLGWTTLSIPFGIAGYTNAFVAQYEGAGRKERVAVTIWQGLFIALIGGLLLFPFLWLSPQIFAWMGHTPEVQELEVAYFALVCPAGLPMLLSTVLSSFFTARKRTAVVMWVNVGISLLNGVLDYFFIFGWGEFEGWGIRGAALATLLSACAGTIAYALLMIRETRGLDYNFAASLRIDRDLLARMIRFGLPNGVQMVLDVGAFTLFVALIGRLGTHEQAATNLAFTLNSLAFIPMIGMGTAVLTLVGHRVGEGQPEKASQTVWKAFALSGGYMAVFAAIYLSLPDVILSPFLHGSEAAEYQQIRPVVVVLLRFVALYTFFDAMAIVFGSAVRGAGDTWFALIFTMGAGWLIMVLPTAWVTRQGGSLYSCWVAVTTMVIVLGIGFLLRFLQGKWKSMQVIEVDPLEGLE